MKRQIVIFLIFLLVLSSLSMAYTQGRDVDSVKFYTMKKSFFIDFNSAFTDRWVTPNNRVMFDDSGEAFMKFVEITPDRLEIYLSNMNKTIYVIPGDTETLTFGNRVITMDVLEAYNFKAHLNFSQEIKETTPVIVNNESEQAGISNASANQTEQTSDDTAPSSSHSNILWFVLIGLAVIGGFIWFFKKFIK